LHISQGQTTPRKLTSQNDLLGTSLTTEFSETTDNWNPGDLLFLHSLALNSESSPEEKLQLDVALNEAISENILLSAQRQSEAILKKVSLSPMFPLISYPKALFSIQRII
jgi:hypothetical protein